MKNKFLRIKCKEEKEMIINFRKSKALPDPIIINDHTVEHVRIYKYLGVMLNNDLSWSCNTDYIISKLNSRLYCLRKLKKFNVNICILKLFHQLVIKSVFTYCCVCWGGNIMKLYINRITGIMKKSGSIMQSNEHSDLSVYYKNAIQRNRQAILKDQNHALHPEFHKHVIARSGRMRIPACSTNRYLNHLYLKLFHCSTVLLHAKLLSFHTNTYNAMILYVGS